jgi:hypothetical protein
MNVFYMDLRLLLQLVQMNLQFLHLAMNSSKSNINCTIVESIVRYRYVTGATKRYGLRTRGYVNKFFTS